jgi:hypothetical protein
VSINMTVCQDVTPCTLTENTPLCTLKSITLFAFRTVEQRGACAKCHGSRNFFGPIGIQIYLSTVDQSGRSEGKYMVYFR